MAGRVIRDVQKEALVLRERLGSKNGFRAVQGVQQSALPGNGLRPLGMSCESISKLGCFQARPGSQYRLLRKSLVPFKSATHITAVDNRQRKNHIRRLCQGPFPWHRSRPRHIRDDLCTSRAVTEEFVSATSQGCCLKVVEIGRIEAGSVYRIPRDSGGLGELAWENDGAERQP